MEGNEIHKSRLEPLKIRLACYCSACENTSLARLAAHTWQHLWFFSGHPNYRTGSLCHRYNFIGIRLVCSGNLNEPEFCARFTGGHVLVEKRVYSTDFRILPNTLAMECILCGDHDRLASLDVELLEEEVACPRRDAVNAFQYAAALGRRDCFAVLIDKLGVTSPLLVGPDGKLSSGALDCCGARFPFGDREGILHLLVSRLSWDSFRPEPLLGSASHFGALWMLSFVFDRFAEAEKKGITSAVELGPSLMEACHGGHLDCARLLLENGADVNAKDDFGQTALIFASENGHTEIVRLLLEHGADVKAIDISGETALTLASQQGHADTVRLLKEHGLS